MQQSSASACSAPSPTFSRNFSSLPLLLLLLFLPPVALAWQRWTDEYTHPSPGPRAGHSLLLWNDSIYLFGGRGNEILTIHDPKTYQIGKVNGTLFFETYDQKHFKECLDESGVGNNDPTNNLTAAAYATCYNILVGTYYNDVWRYNLNCTRAGADGGCVPSEGWDIIGENARLGGCKIYNESEVCTHPHERWEHSASILTVTEDITVEIPLELGSALSDALGGANVTYRTDKRLLEAWHIVYGGFARMCEDYCSDMWAFPIAGCQQNASECRWSQIATLGREGPGKRWRAASTNDDKRWIIFGGHRLWQGFAQANTLYNRWNNTDKFELGGYMDDLWVYSLNPLGPEEDIYPSTTGDPLDDNNEGVGHSIQFGREPPDEGMQAEVVFGEPIPTKLGAWQQIYPREACFRYPGTTWAERNDIICSIAWPPPRASAALVMVGKNFLYLHGGFASPFPYPHVLGRGASSGTGSLASDSRSPYPSYPYYLSDMWRFDFRSGSWRELHPSAAGNGAGPFPRRSHTLVLAGAVLLMVGGYSQNRFFQDFWIYNLTINRWLEKTYFTHPLYPGNCTADVMFDPRTQLEEPIVGPDGKARRSVWGEPTRGTLLDGLFGRASWDVFIQQPRRQAPGWDGCRDRYDSRGDMPAELVYFRPTQRAFHAAVFSEKHDTLLLYGGESLYREEQLLLSATYPTRAVGDLWAWNRNSCPSNCSGVGDCWYGHCYCYEGFYGIDCSNATCPGTYCKYNNVDHIQICQHCCSATYNHTDGEVYIENQRKVPCDDNHFGLSHGICDGFGFCQCAPPFITEDCSVKDCPNNCSAHGWCSVEYPVSRCMCEPPYTGNDCSLLTCLNNCSYPNGECNNATGLCNCSGIKSPYNRTIFFDTWHGDDCSWYRPFAGARRLEVLLLGGEAGFGLALLLVLSVGLAAAGPGAQEAGEEGVAQTEGE